MRSLRTRGEISLVESRDVYSVELLRDAMLEIEAKQVRKLPPGARLNRNTCTDITASSASTEGGSHISVCPEEKIIYILPVTRPLSWA